MTTPSPAPPPPSFPAGTLAAGTVLAEKFLIKRVLGAGAMGAVYAIEHLLTHHTRALKLLHADLLAKPEIVRRFQNEASAAGRAGNPHLVETFDAGTLPTGEPYLVMELLEGETLGDYLAREGRLETARAADLVAQAAEGMAAAHRAGIVHRDLKPENLFLVQRDGALFVKILDFGISKFNPTTSHAMPATRAGYVYGTAGYMAPEQLRGEATVDARADVFALGVLLYQCLAGVHPFDGPTDEMRMLHALMAAPKPLETHVPGVPTGLAEVVTHAMRKEASARLESAATLVQALTPYRSSLARGVASYVSLAPTEYANPTPFPKAPPAPPAPLPRMDPAPVAAVSVGDVPSSYRVQAAGPRRSVIVALVVGTVVVALGVVSALHRSPAEDRAPIAPTSEVSAAPQTGGAPPPITPSSPAAETASAPELSPQKPVVPTPSATSLAHKALPSKTHDVPSPAKPPLADQLGLSQENPFRK